jgi:DNA mismatch repair protein MutL
VSGIIKLLTDAVANQIAAGEVVQRPASIVKELLENSIDAGATEIKLLIKDGGSTLVQVIDNGKGMSETDARLCWERHATSKIRKAEDLFTLKTYGFRGEALASIASIAQVEMKTKREQDEVATYLRIEASAVQEQRVDNSPVGTSIAVKNVFYNIPARRNFLKSITVETKHIYEEFQRQALVNPNISFQLINQQNEVFHYTQRNSLERIIDVIGKYKEIDFIEVIENTDIIQIHGFIGAPNICKKTRGDQYFFVNERFIKSPYFHHAVSQAYEHLIDADSFPTYILFLTVKPEKVDVNVHPTKTEVKFEDEKHIYNILKASIRKSLGQFIVPNDSQILGTENLSQWLNNDSMHRQWEPPKGHVSNSNSFNPFGNQEVKKQYSHQDWQKILGSTEYSNNTPFHQSQNPDILNPVLFENKPLVQILGSFTLSAKYIVANINHGLYIIDIKLALQHFHFTEYLKQLENKVGTTQQLLFPRTIELNHTQLNVLLEIMEDLKYLGFDIGHFGGNTLIINGIPAQLSQSNEQEVLEKIISDYLSTQGEIRLSKHQSMALSMARQNAQVSSNLEKFEEIQHIINQLFSLDSPQFTFDNKQIFISLGSDTIFDMFNKNRKL